MTEEPSSTSIAEPRTKPIHAAICLDAGVYHRYRAVLRHLCVGLIDEIAGVRLVTSAVQAEALTLGPVSVTLYQEPRWPMRKRRLGRLVATLSGAPPSVVHAMSAGSYRVAEWVAAEFDADLVYQVTAVEDIRAFHRSPYRGPRRVICASRPLLDRLQEDTGIAPDDAALIRPGVSCTPEPTCFIHPEREPTLLTTADLTPQGGVDILLEAVQLLQERGHSFITFLLGQGPEEMRLRHVVKHKGLGSAIVFAQPEGDPLKAMVGADIFVQPGVEQALSARSLQALGQGMAVVGVAGGVHDAYLPEETAIVAQAATAIDIASGIERLLVDHELARRLAANAIAHMRQYHSMSAMAERTGQVYRAMALQRATFPMKRA